jgi:histidinol-phosphate aminotransferase
MTGVRPADLIRPEIRELSAYHVPDARGLIKLDAMENPYRWPPEMVAAWSAKLRYVPLNRYPDPEAAELKARLRAALAIPPEVELLLGNGSDELIQLVILALSAPGRVVLAPEPSFVMYRLISRFVGMRYVGVPLGAADFSLDLAAMLEAMERYRPAVVFLAYPNNPTGNRFNEQDVRQVIAAAPGLVVVDEAYFAFAEHSFLTSVAEFDNLLVMRTLSKIGLAGLRLGFLTGAQAWINELDKLRLPYNINILTQMSAEFALVHAEIIAVQARQICEDRRLLLKALQNLPGITAYPSEANFVLFRTPAGKGTHLFEALRSAGILIKNLSQGDLLHDCLRVTVGTPEENQIFLSALAAVLD